MYTSDVIVVIQWLEKNNIAMKFSGMLSLSILMHTLMHFIS